MAIDSLKWLYPDYLKLSSLVKKHDNAHGLILIGNSGIGKKMLAFQLAGDYLNSKKLKPNDNIKFATANEYLESDLFHPDCHFVCPEEKKTSIGIDNIRELKINCLYKTSVKGKGKVGIIYPVELMQVPAATSLLKFLEEPQDETLLILIAENISNIPETIISRVQLHNIKRPSVEETVDWLNKAVTPRFERSRDGGKGKEIKKDWQEIIALFGSRPLLINELGYESLHTKIKKISTDLDSLVLKKSKPSKIASSWSKEDLDMMLKILYILISKMVSDSIIQDEHDMKYLPSSFQKLNRNELNYELCFNYLNEIANIRHLLLNKKPLNWSLQITNLLMPIYADLNGLIQHG